MAHPHIILNVDDDPKGSYIRARVLMRDGHRVLEAVSVSQALRVAEQSHPSLVVMNTQVSDVSGVEFCRRIRQIDSLVHTKIVLILAANVSPPDRAAALSEGADGYLINPVDPDELAATVHALLRLHDREEENRHLIAALSEELDTRKAAEEALRQNEERLRNTERQLLDAATAAECGLWNWNVLTGQLMWFGDHERLAGMLPGGFDGKIESFTSLLHPEDRERVWERLQEAMANQQVDFVEDYRFIHPDGGVHWMRGTGRFYYDASGHAIRMTGVVQDITARKNAEKELRDTAERLRILTTAMPQLVWSCASTGECLYQSPQWERVTGQSPAASLGYGWAQMIHPEDRQRTKKEWQSAVENGEFYQSEYRLHMYDGTYRWHLARAQALRDTSGNVQEWVGTSTDIEDAKRTTQALRVSQARLASQKEALERALQGAPLSTICDIIVKAMQEASGTDARAALFLVSPDGACLRFGASVGVADSYIQAVDGFQIGPHNPSCGSAAYTGQPILVRDVELDPLWQPYIQLARDHNIRACFSFPILSIRSGVLGTLAVYYAVPQDPLPAMVDAIGLLTRTIALIIEWKKEVEERERMEDALRSSQEELRALASHLETRVQERTEELVQSQKRLRALAAELSLAEERERKRLALELHDHLQQLLVLSKMKLIQARHLPELPVSCEKFVTDAEHFLAESLAYSRTLVANLSPQVLHQQGLAAGLIWLGEFMKKHDLTVSVNLPEEKLTLSEDQAILIFQSVRELLLNVSKHAGTHCASISVQRDNERLCIAVSDRGRGFSIPTTGEWEASPGTYKFGLFSIRERMKALGGSVSIQSTPGEGSTITLILPV